LLGQRQPALILKTRPSFLENGDIETTGKTTGKAEALLDFISKHKDATIPQMAVALCMTEDGVNYHLRNLRTAKRLKRTGGRKLGHWNVLK